MQYKRCHNLKVLYVINDQPNEWNYTDVNLTDCFVPSTDVWSSSKTTTWRIEKSKTTRMLHNTWYKHDTPYTGPKNVRNGIATKVTKIYVEGPHPCTVLCFVLIHSVWITLLKHFYWPVPRSIPKMRKKNLTKNIVVFQ